MVRVLDQIRADGFRPDATRSGMITPVAGRVPATPTMGTGAEQMEAEAAIAPVKEEQAWPVEIDGVIDLDEMELANELLERDSSSSSDSGSRSSSDGDSDVEVEASSAAQPPPIRNQVDAEYFINTSSLVIHRRKSSGVFQCGRKNSSSFVPVLELHGYRCGSCFRE